MEHQGPELTAARKALGFTSLVLEEGEFLVKQFGFKCTKTLPTLVVFGHRRSQVTFFHGRSSYQLGVEFELRGSSTLEGEKLSLEDIVSFKGQAANAATFQASSRTDLVAGIKRVMSLLKSYAIPLLKGDEAEFHEIVAHQHERSRQYTLSIKDRQVRVRAEAAWKAKRFEDVIAAYEDLEDRLTPSRAKEN